MIARFRYDGGPVERHYRDIQTCLTNDFRIAWPTSSVSQFAASRVSRIRSAKSRFSLISVRRQRHFGRLVQGRQLVKLHPGCGQHEDGGRRDVQTDAAFDFRVRRRHDQDASLWVLARSASDLVHVGDTGTSPENHRCGFKGFPLRGISIKKWDPRVEI